MKIPWTYLFCAFLCLGVVSCDYVRSWSTSERKSVSSTGGNEQSRLLSSAVYPVGGGTQYSGGQNVGDASKYNTSASPCALNQQNCKTEVVQSIANICPTGYIYDRNQCVRSEVNIQRAEKLLHCKAGFQMINGQCVSHGSQSSGVAAFKSCPSGYNLYGNMCYPIQSPVRPIEPVMPVVQPVQPIQPGTQCPHGYTWNGVNCDQYVPTCQGPPCAYGQITQPQCGGYLGVCPMVQSCCPPIPPPFPPPITPPFPPPITPPFSPSIPPPAPIPPTIDCPPGYVLMNNWCFIQGPDIIIVAPIESCPNEYYFVNGECVKSVVIIITKPPITCPPGSILTALGCVIYTCCNETQPTTNCTITPCPKPCPPCPPQPCPTSEQGSSNLTNYINNDNPVNVTNNVNVNTSTNIVIHLSTDSQQATIDHDGNSSVITFRPHVVPIPDPVPQPNCCTVASPRMCRRAEGGSWSCFHRKKEVCSSMCERPRIYIRPRRPVYHHQVLVTVPMRRRIPMPIYPDMHDCSGCYNRGYCSEYCSSYDCGSSDCSYMGQENYCHQYGGDFCSEDYGCLDEEYCSGGSVDY
ncbi:hypothetical protein DMENIID0001_031260 [Sergentomyia squamirostris]